ncbi:hypothetical protein [Streptomyces luomodiensis]
MTREAQFFEFGREEIGDAGRVTPDRSRAERRATPICAPSRQEVAPPH